MFWVYILELANGKYYIGQTNNLARRLLRHQNGECRFTKVYLPVKLSYSEVLNSRKEAIQRERYLKSLKSHKLVQSLIIKSDGGLIV